MIRQSVVMTALNLLSLPQRWGSALIDVFGVACVVAVFVGLFAVVASYQALLVTGSDDSVLMVMKSGAGAENDSSIAQDDAASVVTAARAADPKVVISPETSRLISVKRPQNHDFVTVALRGAGPDAIALREGMKLVAGRMVQSGRYELLVGRASQKQFAGLQLGTTLHLADSDWRIVGVFAATVRQRVSNPEYLGRSGRAAVRLQDRKSDQHAAPEAHQRCRRRKHP